MVILKQESRGDLEGEVTTDDREKTRRGNQEIASVEDDNAKLKMLS